MTIEVLLAVIHIPPFIDYWDLHSDDMHYAIKIVTIVVFIKLFFIIEVTTTASPINSQKGKFVG